MTYSRKTARSLFGTALIAGKFALGWYLLKDPVAISLAFSTAMVAIAWLWGVDIQSIASEDVAKLNAGVHPIQDDQPEPEPPPAPKPPPTPEQIAKAYAEAYAAKFSARLDAFEKRLPPIPKAT